MGYINLYSTFKNCDYDRDGLIYLKDWQKIVIEYRLQLSEMQLKSLFSHYS